MVVSTNKAVPMGSQTSTILFRKRWGGGQAGPGLGPGHARTTGMCVGAICTAETSCYAPNFNRGAC